MERQSLGRARGASREPAWAARRGRAEPAAGGTAGSGGTGGTTEPAAARPRAEPAEPAASAATGGTSGASGLGGSGGAASGAGGTAGGAGAGGRDYSTDRSTFFGEPRCAGFAVCESFESTNVGALPAGFTLEGYGQRTVTTVDDLAARGSRSLGLEIPSQGSVTAWLTRGSLGTLAEAHFGRVFVFISEPAPPEFVHFDVFAGIGPFGGHSNEVRWASTGTGVGTAGSNWSFIYNVQPFGSGAGGEFGTEGPRSAHPTVGAWMCLEWSFDAAAQEARFFLDGVEMEYLHIDTERAEIPVFETLAVGFAKYQNTGAFLVHVDELAFDASRIGCNN